MSSLVRQLRSRPAHITDHEASVAARYSVQLAELLQCLQQLHREWQQYIDEGHSLPSYRAPLLHSAGPGRPKFMITQNQIYYLRSMSFSWVQIASLLGVS